MIKRIISFLTKNYTNALRDNMIIYGALFPILLAFVMTFFIPSVESMKLTVAVERNVGQNVIDGFSKYAEVEMFDTRELLQQRVERNDDIAGIVKEGDEYVVLLEGNESGEAAEIASSLMDMILSDEPIAQYEHVSLGKTNSRIKEISGALLLLTSVLIGGYIVGFSIVDEKETKSIRALSVSPLKMTDFLLSHTILTLITGIILAVIACLILAGGSISYIQIVLSIIATTGVGLIMGFIIGGLSNNLLSAIAIVKFEMLVFLGVPISSIFVPQGLQWIFYLFPNYWAFQSYLNIFNGGTQPLGFAISSWMAFISSMIVIILLTPMLKRRLKLR